jgi:hypothetical protein
LGGRFGSKNKILTTKIFSFCEKNFIPQKINADVECGHRLQMACRLGKPRLKKNNNKNNNNVGLGNMSILTLLLKY